MSLDSDSGKKVPTEFILEAAEFFSSEDPPMEDWSSLESNIAEENPKKSLYEKGLFSVGSGEVSAQYIALSDSSVLRHYYYNYPAVLDPGIKEALLDPEKPIVYAEDGQDLYIDLCKEMNQCPVKIFLKGLLEETIDLKYYCVSSQGVYAMALALEANTNVQVLNLTDNFLDQDACYHLGQMLLRNSGLIELNLSGCKIGPEGLKRLLAGLKFNYTLVTLNISRNDLGDDGAQYLADAVFAGLNVKVINLSHNKIASKGAGALGEAFETYNKFTSIDLSWNNLCSPVGVFNLLSRLAENKNLQDLILSWNSMAGSRLATAIRNVTAASNLRLLDLSNNRFLGEDIPTIIADLKRAKKMQCLDLSYNPMSTYDALRVLTKMKSKSVKIQRLIMENVPVDEEFLKLLQQFQNMKTKKNFVVTYGLVVNTFKAKGPDPREILLDRVDFLKRKHKKSSGDLCLVAMQLLKDKIETLEAKDFSTALSMAAVPFDEDLVDEIINVFAGPRTDKAKTIDIKLLVDYIKRKWPEKKLPPTPPLESESVEAKPTKKGDKKRKKK